MEEIVNGALTKLLLFLVLLLLLLLLALSLAGWYAGVDGP
jgi:hypothetical protein